MTSAYISPCVLSMVPEDVDLVLLEFTLNDGEREGEDQSSADSTRSVLRQHTSRVQNPALLELMVGFEALRMLCQQVTMGRI